MRLLHTSDWHLGHTLRDISRDVEHTAFLQWLLDTAETERIDLLLITGDVFDTSVPKAATETLWFDFLAEARRRLPAMQLVVIAGNHDSPARLGAAAGLCAPLGVHVVTRVGTSDAPGLIDLGAALVVPIPYIRPSDLLPGEELAAGTARVMAELLACARSQRRPGQAIIAMAHQYVVGVSVDWLSERRANLGGSDAIHGALFESDIAYVALGHIHKAQRVGRDSIRYAGAPIPLAIDEARYHHSVVRVIIDGETASDISLLPVPRTVDLLRIPKRGALPLAEALLEIAQLPGADDVATASWPFVEVVIALDAPTPQASVAVAEAMASRRARLVRIGVEWTGSGRVLAEQASTSLAQLSPEEVLAKRWAQRHEGDVPDALRREFAALLAEVA